MTFTQNSVNGLSERSMCRQIYQYVLVKYDITLPSWKAHWSISNYLKTMNEYKVLAVHTILLHEHTYTNKRVPSQNK